MLGSNPDVGVDNVEDETLVMHRNEPFPVYGPPPAQLNYEQLFNEMVVSFDDEEQEEQQAEQNNVEDEVAMYWHHDNELVAVDRPPPAQLNYEQLFNEIVVPFDDEEQVEQQAEQEEDERVSIDGELDEFLDIEPMAAAIGLARRR